ncbi:unnamed protein product, partial [Amoebophrya sp. A25]
GTSSRFAGEQEDINPNSEDTCSSRSASSTSLATTPQSRRIVKHFVCTNSLGGHTVKFSRYFDADSSLLTEFTVRHLEWWIAQTVENKPNSYFESDTKDSFEKIKVYSLQSRKAGGDEDPSAKPGGDAVQPEPNTGLSLQPWTLLKGVMCLDHATSSCPEGETLEVEYISRPAEWIEARNHPIPRKAPEDSEFNGRRGADDPVMTLQKGFYQHVSEDIPTRMGDEREEGETERQLWQRMYERQAADGYRDHPEVVFAALCLSGSLLGVMPPRIRNDKFFVRVAVHPECG